MWKQAIVRELSIVLLIKLAALILIWLAFFHHPDSTPSTAQDMDRLLLGSNRGPVASSPSITD